MELEFFQKNKKLVLLVIAALIALGLGIGFKIKTSAIEIDGKYSISDDKFKKSLRSQLSKNAEILTIIDENSGVSRPDEDMGSNTSNSGIKSDTALIVYKTEDKNNPLRVMIMKRSGGSWMEVETIGNIGESYEEIGLEDMDRDGEPEVILGLGASKNSNNSIMIYKREGNKYARKINEKYEEIFIDDFDGDGSKVLVTLRKNPESDSLSLNAFSFLTNGEIKKHSCNVGSIEEKLSVKLNRLNDVNKGFTVQKELENKNSEIMVYKLENYKFSIVPIDGENVLRNSYFVEVDDKNGDRIVDIPIQKKTHSSMSEESGKSPYINYWSEFDRDFVLHTVMREYRSEENRFVFNIPNSWGENVDIKIKRDENREKNSIIFDTFDENDNYRNKITIGVYSLQEWLRMLPEEVNKDNIIFKSENKVYVLEASSGEEETDISSVKSNFRVMYDL